MIENLKRLGVLIEEEKDAGLTKKPALAREAARVSLDVLRKLAVRVVQLESEVKNLKLELMTKEIEK